jgi:transposase
VLEEIRDMASTGCQRRAIPKDFWPYSTVQGHVYAWSHGTCWLNNSPMPVMARREHLGREASPSRPASSTAGR